MTSDLELRAIDRQQRRFAAIGLLAIVVSFVHMAAALALFSRESWYEQAAALAMTALVDIATWMLAGYVDYARRRQLSRSFWIKALFGFALAISMFLNGAYLYANRPPDALLPEWMSIGIAATFALFVPLLIGVAALIRGELEDDRPHLARDAAREDPRLADLRQQLAGQEQEIANSRARLADHEGAVATAHEEAATLRSQLARGEQEIARLRESLAGAQSLNRQLRDAPAPIPSKQAQIAYAVRETARGRSQLEVARELDVPEATLRGWLKNQTNGHHAPA